jgi:hypothetical protein
MPNHFEIIEFSSSTNYSTYQLLLIIRYFNNIFEQIHNLQHKLYLNIKNNNKNERVIVEKKSYSKT